MKGIGHITQMLAVAIVVGAAVYWLTKDGGGSTSIVTVEQIKKIAQLATINYHLSVTHYHEKPPKGLEWLPAKLFATVRGDIKGSVDMKKADIDIINEKEKKFVKIVFPKGSVIISNPEIGAKDVSFLTCSNPNPFHPLKDKDFTAAQREAIKAMIKAAKGDGIAVKTAREAKSVLGNFLAALDFQSEITFQDDKLNAAVMQENGKLASFEAGLRAVGEPYIQVAVTRGLAQ